jgi:hypothetical protein
MCAAAARASLARRDPSMRTADRAQLSGRRAEARVCGVSMPAAVETTESRPSNRRGRTKERTTASIVNRCASTSAASDVRHACAHWLRGLGGVCVAQRLLRSSEHSTRACARWRTGSSFSSLDRRTSSASRSTCMRASTAASCSNPYAQRSPSARQHSDAQSGTAQQCTAGERYACCSRPGHELTSSFRAAPRAENLRSSSFSRATNRRSSARYSAVQWRHVRSAGPGEQHDSAHLDARRVGLGRQRRR